MAHLVVLDAYLKQKNGLTVEEIRDIAEEVVAKYYWEFSFADINVIFTNARRGVYGELYQTLTADKVLKWFNDYSVHRGITAYEQSRERDRGEFGDSTADLVDKGYIYDIAGNIVGIDKKMKEDYEQRQPQTHLRKEDFNNKAYKEYKEKYFKKSN